MTYNEIVNAINYSSAITLLVASKTNSPESLREAFAVGQTIFGENCLQEALVKIEALVDLPNEWHFIGPTPRILNKLLASHYLNSISLLPLNELRFFRSLLYLLNSQYFLIHPKINFQFLVMLENKAILMESAAGTLICWLVIAQDKASNRLMHTGIRKLGFIAIKALIVIILFIKREISNSDKGLIHL